MKQGCEFLYVEDVENLKSVIILWNSDTGIRWGYFGERRCKRMYLTIETSGIWISKKLYQKLREHKNKSC